MNCGTDGSLTVIGFTTGIVCSFEPPLTRVGNFIRECPAPMVSRIHSDKEEILQRLNSSNEDFGTK
jgi:hypothetical protein